MTAVAPPVASLSRWRASPRRLLTLLVGLWLFGAGDALLVASALGNSPWTVFAEGVSRQTPLSVGAATVAASAIVLLLWIPLRERPGLGTIANAVVVGIAIDVTLHLLPGADATPLVVRWIELALGIVIVAVGSAIYLGTQLGPGPRDGLRTGPAVARALRLGRISRAGDR